MNLLQCYFIILLLDVSGNKKSFLGVALKRSIWEVVLSGEAEGGEWHRVWKMVRKDVTGFSLIQ